MRVPLPFKGQELFPLHHSKINKSER
jgi:hypothetical protein